jgi:hypothetical protein
MNRPPPPALVLIVLGAAGLAGCQTTGGRTVSPVAVGGVPLRLGHFADLNPDCSQIGEPDVRVTKPADHGVVTVRAGEGYTNFVPSNPRNHCNYRPTPGVNATYTAERGYTGPDTVALDAIFETGEERQLVFDLNVKQAMPPQTDCGARPLKAALQSCERKPRTGSA